MLHRLIYILPLLLLVGCSSTMKPVATLMPNVSVVLPAPQKETPIHREQLLSATVNGKSHSIHTVLDADGKQVTLVGLSPMGIRLFRAIYDSKGIVTKQLAVIGELPPASQVLADIMLSYWPVDDWQKRLPAGWRLIDENAGLRVLRDAKDEIVEEIHYTTDGGGSREPVRIKHLVYGYEISITNLDEEDAAP